MTPSKTCTKCNQSKPTECFYRLYPKTDKPYLHSRCKDCMKQDWKSNSKANPELAKERQKRFRVKNKESLSIANRERCKKYREKNLDAIRQREANRKKSPESASVANRKWYEKNRDSAIAARKEYAIRKPEIALAKKAKRRAALLKATPSWANSFFIEEAYRLLRVREMATGIKWNVDHIVPLVSKKVCGLHCEANLQVIPASSNRSKSNVWWPDMP